MIALLEVLLMLAMMVIMMAIIVLLFGLLVIVLVTTISMLMGSIDVFSPPPNLQPPGCRLFLNITLSARMIVDTDNVSGSEVKI